MFIISAAVAAADSVVSDNLQKIADFCKTASDLDGVMVLQESEILTNVILVVIASKRSVEYVNENLSDVLWALNHRDQDFSTPKAVEEELFRLQAAAWKQYSERPGFYNDTSL